MNRIATAAAVAALSLAFAAPASAFEIPRCFENPAFVELESKLYVDAGDLFEAAALTQIDTLEMAAEVYASGADSTIDTLVKARRLADAMQEHWGTVASTKLGDALQDARKERNQLRDERDQVNATRAELRTEIRALRNVARELRQAMREAATGDDIEGMRRALKQVSQKMDDLRAERAAATAVRNELRAELRIVRGALRALRAGRCLVRHDV